MDALRRRKAPVHATSRRRVAVSATVAATTLALTLSGAFAPPPASALEPVSDRIVTGPDGSAFGSTVSQERCDVDGDGVADLAVGTYSTFDFTPGATGGYVLLGAADGAASATVDESAPVRIIDTARTRMGGVDVRCAGDVNADGIDDLVVVSQSAAVFLVFGSRDFSDVTLDTLASAAAS
ncbi:hypothetical protein F8O01_00740 [Pseudoclavibacter chungangensis]|uniref:VCBS repeat-containing protein n=1 Tax=Pseudoclavibacter chungangensis TaxID=587635 RepID=A0A7J5C1K6_9MICO|nr:hypothetical protein F8O01_00740 [Pseudoclavibacter chungangensis]